MAETTSPEKDRKLRLAESAAASAILNGATPEEVRERMEIGIAEAMNLPARRTQQELAYR